MKNRVVYNRCFGGFGVSEAGKELYKELSGEEIESDYNLSRHDPFLIQVVEQLGEKASDVFGDLAIFEIPGCEYNIEDYDGQETVECPEDSQHWVLIDSEESRAIFPEKFL